MLISRFLALFAVLMGLSACFKQEVSKREVFPRPEGAKVVDISGKYGSMFVSAQAQAPKTFNPLVSGGLYSAMAISKLQASLVDYEYDKDKLVPGLAERWERSEDQLSYIFYLRKGLKWSDGADFTADDVIFTLDAIFDERYPNRLEHQLSIGDKPIQYRKLDKYRVEMSAEELYAPFVNDVSFVSIMPKHVLWESYQNGDLQERWSIDEVAENPDSMVGMGAFRMNRFAHGERMVLEPNPHYYKFDRDGKRLPYLDFLIHKYVPDVNTSLVLFSSGQTDAATISARDLSWVAEGAQEYQYKIYNMGPSAGVSYIWFNMKPGVDEDGEHYVAPHKLKWFTDKRFRHAIMHGMDREGLVEALTLGKGRLQHSVFTPADGKWFNPNVKEYEYDPEKAMALLESMGFEQDEEGWYYDSEGHELAFDLITNDGSQGTAQLMTSVKENMTDMGVQLNLMFMDFGTILEKISGTYKYEASSLSLSGGGDPSGGKAVYLSSGRLHQWNPEQETPATEWEAEIDRIFEASQQEMDETKRIALIHQMQEIFAEELPLLFTVNPDAFIGVRKCWKNLKLHPVVPLWNIDEIWTNVQDCDVIDASN